jgi:hypothetical protein
VSLSLQSLFVVAFVRLVFNLDTSAYFCSLKASYFNAIELKIGATYLCN